MNTTSQFAPELSLTLFCSCLHPITLPLRQTASSILSNVPIGLQEREPASWHNGPRISSALSFQLASVTDPFIKRVGPEPTVAFLEPRAVFLGPKVAGTDCGSLV